MSACLASPWYYYYYYYYYHHYYDCYYYHYCYCYYGCLPRFSLVLWRWPRGGVWWCCRWWCRSLSLSLASLVDRGGHRGAGRLALGLGLGLRTSG